MNFEDENEPKLFWVNPTERNPTGEFPPLTAADVDQLKPVGSDPSKGDDWLKTESFKTSKVESEQPQQDLASNIALSMRVTGEHPKPSSKPSAVLRPAPSAPISASFLDSERSMARPIAAVALGLMVAGAAVVFVASRNLETTEVASSEGTVPAERPPLAPALVAEQPSSGSPGTTDDVEEETTTTTKPKQSEPSEKTKVEQAAKRTTGTTAPATTEATTTTVAPTTEATTTTVPPTTEATTTVPPTTEATTTTSTTVEDQSNSVD